MQILIWDLPTRLFHWLFALSFVVTWITGDSDTYRDLHVFMGYLMLGLLGFRLVWGLVGSRYARFRAFLFSLGQAFRYLANTLTRTAPRHIGHNPAGAWAVYLMLTLGLLVSISGILVLGGEEQHGIASSFTLYAGGETLKELHEALASVMLAVVIVHLAGVAVESWLHQENLVKAMFTGLKKGAAAEAISSRHYLVGAILMLLVVIFGAWFFQGYFTQTLRSPYLPFVGQMLPDNKVWREECGSCHVAYHPTLLPARSWTLLMQKQNEHFGEALDLDATTTAAILTFLKKYSADTEMTEPAYKIKKSIPPNTSPLRVTETGYWIDKHREIPDATWRSQKVGSKANCGACHLDAEKGTFEDAAMHLPEGVTSVPQVRK